MRVGYVILAELLILVVHAGRTTLAQPVRIFSAPPRGFIAMSVGLTVAMPVSLSKVTRNSFRGNSKREAKAALISAPTMGPPGKDATAFA